MSASLSASPYQSTEQYTVSDVKFLTVDTIVAPSSPPTNGPTTLKLAYQTFTPTESTAAQALPCIFLRGWQGVKEDWLDIAKGIAVHRPVLVYDNRCIGESDVSEVPFTMNEFVADAISLINAVYSPTQRVHLVGVSMGGMMALQLLVNHSDRIASAVLGCTNASSKTCDRDPEFVKFTLQPTPSVDDKEAYMQYQLQLLGLFMTPEFIQNPQNAELLQLLRENRTRYKRTVVGGRLQGQAIATHDVTDHQLSQITTPCLIQHGNKDRTVVYSNGKHISEHIPNAKLSMYENAGHAYWNIDWQNGVNSRMIKEASEWFQQHENMSSN